MRLIHMPHIHVPRHRDTQVMHTQTKHADHSVLNIVALWEGCLFLPRVVKFSSKHTHVLTHTALPTALHTELLSQNPNSNPKPNQFTRSVHSTDVHITG